MHTQYDMAKIQNCPPGYAKINLDSTALRMHQVNNCGNNVTMQALCMGYAMMVALTWKLLFMAMFFNFATSMHAVHALFPIYNPLWLFA